MVCPPNIFAGPLDRLSELTDEAALAVVTLKGRDNFNSEDLYDMNVKNLSADPLVGESLVVVLDKVSNIGGDDRMSGTDQSNLGRMEIPGQEGETDDGKPYFRIPGGPALDLPPYSQSRPAAVRIRNKDYLIMFTPKFRVYGLKRMHPPVTFSQDPDALSITRVEWYTFLRLQRTDRSAGGPDHLGLTLFPKSCEREQGTSQSFVAGIES